MTETMKIALDTMGGDFGPRVTVAGAAKFAESSGSTVLLVGAPDQLQPLVAQSDIDKLVIVPSTETIEMDEHPVQAVRHKKDSSLVVGARLVRESLHRALL